MDPAFAASAYEQPELTRLLLAESVGALIADVDGAVEVLLDFVDKFAFIVCCGGCWNC